MSDAGVHLNLQVHSNNLFVSQECFVNDYCYQFTKVNYCSQK